MTHGHRRIPVTDAEREISDKLETLLGGENKRYLVIDREAHLENPNMGRYRIYGNIGVEDNAASSVDSITKHVLNFLDGYLDNGQFEKCAHLIAMRALERRGIDASILDKLLDDIIPEGEGEGKEGGVNRGN